MIVQGRGKTTLLSVLRDPGTALPPNVSTVGVSVHKWTVRAPRGRNLSQRVSTQYNDYYHYQQQHYNMLVHCVGAHFQLSIVRVFVFKYLFLLVYGSITVDSDCIGILCSCQSYVHVNGIIHLFNGQLMLVTGYVCVCEQ